MTVGTLAYVVNDALIRRSTEEGLDVYQSLFLRGCLMVVIFAGWAVARGHRPSDLRADGPTRRRVGAEVIATACFFAAIVRLEFANAQTILMVVPFLVTLVAAQRLGGDGDARRYAFIAVGFVGVVAVVRPLPAQFSAWSLLVVVAALLLVVREFATRHIDPTIPPVVVALQTARDHVHDRRAVDRHRLGQLGGYCSSCSPAPVASSSSATSARSRQCGSETSACQPRSGTPQSSVPWWSGSPCSTRPRTP